jgi:hypothetical protein
MDDESLCRDPAACRGADPELFFPLTESGRREFLGWASRVQSGSKGQRP